MNRRKFLLGSALILPTLQFMPASTLLADDANTLFVMDVEVLKKIRQSLHAASHGVMALDIPVDVMWREHLAPMLADGQPTIVGITDEMSAFQLQMFGTEHFYRRDTVDLEALGVDIDVGDHCAWSLQPMVRS